MPNWVYRVALNVAKTQPITSLNSRLAKPAWLADPLEQQSDYLKVVIDRRLSLTGQVKKAARTAMFLLRPLFRSHLLLRTKL